MALRNTRKRHRRKNTKKKRNFRKQRKEEEQNAKITQQHPQQTQRHLKSKLYFSSGQKKVLSTESRRISTMLLQKLHVWYSQDFRTIPRHQNSVLNLCVS